MQKRNIFWIFYLAYISMVLPCFAETIDEIFITTIDTTESPTTIIPHSQLVKPKIGLALSGGGMRGIAQIGVLQVFEANNIPIDCIVGTSIGAVIGALYASGYSADEIYEFSKSMDWSSLLKDEAERSSLFLGEKQKRNRSLIHFQMKNLMPVIPKAFSPGQKLTGTFSKIFFQAPIYSNDFSKLKVPLKIISTDLLSGEKITLTRGDLSTCVRGSISIPLLFKPVQMDSFLLVDGGVSQNIPVIEAQQSGMDYVIAVDATSPLRTIEQLSLPWEIADQVTTIMQQNSDKQQADMADVLISFEDIYSINTNFDELDKLYIAGIHKAEEKLAEIKNLLQPKTKNDQLYHIDFISNSNSDINIHFETPGELSRAQIKSELERIYISGCYSKVSAKINVVEQDTLLEIIAVDNAKLKAVKFKGNKSIPDDSLRIIFRDMFDKPICEQQSKKAIINLLRAYRARGYSLAVIPTIDFDYKTGTATFTINEGVIDKIEYSGLQKTKRWVIKRESRIQKGQIFQYANLQQTVDNIYATNLFSNIIVELTPNENNYDLMLHFSEKQSDIIRMGARYDEERYGKFFIEYADENIVGTGNDLTFHALYGERDSEFFIDYRADQILQTFLTLHMNIHHQKSDHYSYENMHKTGAFDRLNSGFSLEVGRQLERFGSLTAQIKIENIDITRRSGSGFGYGNMKVNSLGIQSVIDTRDNVPFPKSGKHHIFQYVVTSGQIFENWGSYFHVLNQLATVSTLNERHTFLPKLMWGTSDPGTPYSEQFKLGGQNSFYGLQKDQLSGIHIFLTSLGYRYKLPKILKMDSYFSLRYDLGGAWKKLEDINPAGFLSGYGAALMMKTPFGPLQIDYGRTNSGNEQFYFSAGYVF